jgi:hypothetical protein
MQPRTRRPQGIGTKKISVSVTETDLRALSTRAARDHGGNVSAVVHELVAAMKREEAAVAALDLLGGDRVTDEQMDALRSEIARAPVARGKRRPAA